jgi:hypothetical protein
MMVNSAQPGERAPPLTLSTVMSKVVVYAPAEGADTLLLFLLYPFLFYDCGNTDFLGNKFYCVRSGGDVRSHWYNFAFAFQCGISVMTTFMRR